MKSYVDKGIVCPFYTKENGSKIHCEGFSHSTSIQTSFNSNDLLITHKCRYCRNIARYTTCPLYPIIEKKYYEEVKHD